MKIELKILNKKYYFDGSKIKGLLPYYSTDGSAGVDLVACDDYIIYPGETVAIHTGIAIHIGTEFLGDRTPDSYFYDNNSVMGMITPRSGLGTRGLVLANTVGIIDEDYQGEIIVQAWNRKEEYEVAGTDKEGVTYYTKILTRPIEIKAGDRFCQLIFVPVIKAQFQVVEEFSSPTERGNGSFGSSGR